MSEHNETHADIIAEMRHGFDQSWHDIDREWAHGLADRIEAVWEREECSRRGAEAQSGERIEDIVAELREDGDAVMSENHNDDCWSNFEAGQIYYELAARIEAAHRREMSKIVSKNGVDFGQLGDAARLREALEQLSDKVCDYLQKGLIQLPLPIEGLLKQARDALAAPPRNCDVGTAEELREGGAK